MVMGLATATFTPEEEHLVQLLPPTGPIDSVWINEADNLISGNYNCFSWRKKYFEFKLIWISFMPRNN